MTQTLEKTYTIEVPIKISGETVSDILYGALTQGNTYWLGEVKSTNTDDNIPYNEALLHGSELLIEAPTTDDDSEYETYTLTMDKFLNGLKLYLQEGHKCIDIGEVDSCMIDSVDCDLILQYALFNGEQIFG